MRIAWFLGLMMAVAFVASHAKADPIETLTFGGSLNYGNDGSKLFGSSGGNMAGETYSISIAYDPLTLSGDTCGVSSNNSCQWNFTAASPATVKITIAGFTETLSGTGGDIQYCACTADAIYYQISGTNFEFGGDFVDSTSFFASQTDVNNPELLNFSNASLTGGYFQADINANNNSTSFGAGSSPPNPSAVSAALTTTSVPEPASLALLGAALVALGAIRRRRV